MSVTFSCPGAPTVTVPCQWCVVAQDRNEATPEGRCDKWCEGFTRESVAPTCNFANASIRALAPLLGIDAHDLCGDIEHIHLGSFRQRILLAKNSATTRQPLVQAGYEIEGGHAGMAVVNVNGIPTFQKMGAHVVNFGNTDDQTIGRLNALDRLASWAQDNGFGLSWG